MYYDEETIEQVRSANDIVDVVGMYVQLRRSGSHYFGLCPFHNEKTGSFSVNKNLQIYKCFGCGEGGNVFGFIQKYENVGFPEAVRILADRAGISLPEQDYDDEQRKRISKRELIARVNKEAATFFYRMLRTEEGAAAHKYLTDRGLSEETINRFGLGFAGRYSDGLYKYLKSKEYTDEELQMSGLFNFGEKGVYDKFSNRVMFPIMDVRNRVIAFGGRIMGSAENVAKYLNSPETDLFLKSENLYGLHVAKRTREKFFLLCEGYMDVIALHQAGFDNAVASLGTSLTERQAKKLTTYTENVIITYDSDGAGTKAALRAIPILKNVGLSVKILNMDPYKDPDEFIKAIGAGEYRKRIDGAAQSFDFEAGILEKTHNMDDPDDKTKFDHAIAETIAKIDDPMARHNHIEAAARKYNIEASELKREVNSIGARLLQEENNTREKEIQKATREKKAEDGDIMREHLLLNIIVQNEKAYKLIKDIIGPSDFGRETERKVYEYIIDEYEKMGSAVGARIVDKCTDADEQSKVADILMTTLEEDMNESERRKAFADLVSGIKKAGIERSMQKAVESNNGQELKKLLEEERSLTELKKKLLNSEI